MTAEKASRAGGPVTWIDNESSVLGAAWYPAALASELTDDEPLAVQLLGKHWVLARIGGILTCFWDRCPHRLMPLSAGTICANTLRCCYHGWEFDASGAPARIPSMGSSRVFPPSAHLSAAAGVDERYGVIWVAPEPPVSPIPSFPEWDDESFECRIDTPGRTSASCPQVMDNTCDVSHFAFVHAGTFGGEEAETAQPRTITRDGWTVTAVYETPYRVLDDPRTQTGELAETQISTQTKTIHLGAALELRMEFPDTSSTFTILVAVQPECNGRTRVYRWFARDDIVGDEARWAECLKVEEAVLAEDMTTLGNYRDPRVNLDLREEVHVSADKLSVAYRRMVSEFVNSSTEARSPTAAKDVSVGAAVVAGTVAALVCEPS